MSIALSRRLKQIVLGHDVLTDSSLRDALPNFTLCIFGGTRPTTPESSTSEIPLLTYYPCNFLGSDYDSTIENVVLKKTSAVWVDVADGTGTAVWFRVFINGADTGRNADTFFTYSRIDGDVSETVGDLVLSDVSITIAGTKVIDQFNITIAVV